PINLEGKKLELTTLVQVLEGNELFADSKTIFIEELLSQRQSKEHDRLITYLLEQQKNHSILLWEGKDLSKLKNPLISSATLRSFMIPKTIFQFIEAI